MISRSSLGDALGGIRGVIDDLLAPYPFNRNISLKHPTGKTHILIEEQVGDFIDSIPSKFDDKRPSIKRTETEEKVWNASPFTSVAKWPRYSLLRII